MSLIKRERKRPHPDTNSSLSQPRLGTPGVLPFVKHVSDSLTPSECDYPRYECDYECYVLDVNNCEIRKVLERFPDPAFPFSSFLVLGSCIYVLGGILRSSDPEFPILKDVFCFDSDNLEKKWENVSYMLSSRSPPQAAVLDGKIYVFGRSIEGGFAEFYDTSIRSWASLDDKIPSKIIDGPFFISYPVLADSSHRRILVHNHFTGSLYAHCIDSGEWVCIDEKYGKWSASVVVCGVIYSLSTYKDGSYCFKGSYCSLSAYHVDVKKHLSTKWSPDSDFNSKALHVQPHSAGLFHLGNDKLCLVWQSFDDVKYIKLSVHKDKDSGEIRVIPERECVAANGFEGLADFSVIK